MIRNWLRLPAAVSLILGACQSAPAATEEPLQGIVELDERVLGFEVGGRVTQVTVKRGEVVHADELLATLDDSLGKTAREARAAEADAAKSQVALLKAGARPEEIRAMEARVRAVKSTEALLTKNVARERELEKRGVSSRSLVDELETRLEATIADRQALEQQLKGLKRGARSQEIDSAKSRAQAADKGLTLESERVERHSLKSTREGVVLDVHVEEGEVVAPGAPVVTVGDAQHPYADVFVPLGKLDGVKVGASATLRVDSPSATFTAKVEHVARATEFTPRFLFSERERPNLVVRVRLRIDDPEQRLHAGMPAFAQIEHGK